MLETGAVKQQVEHSSPAEVTFVIRLDGPSWHVADHRGDAGGIFTTLDAALTFARRESARFGSARVVIVGAGPASERAA